MDGSDRLADLALVLLDACRARGLTLATAESCTGGLIVACLTDVPGSSAVVDRGYVAYANEAKGDMLGVPMALIERHGAVSEPVARAMAKGALTRSRVDLSVAVTGIAGPGGGSAEKPEGLVHFAWARRADGHLGHERVEFGALGRATVRALTVEHALAGLLALAEEA